MVVSYLKKMLSSDDSSNRIQKAKIDMILLRDEESLKSVEMPLSSSQVKDI